MSLPPVHRGAHRGAHSGDVLWAFPSQGVGRAPDIPNEPPHRRPESPGGESGPASEGKGESGAGWLEKWRYAALGLNALSLGATCALWGARIASGAPPGRRWSSTTLQLMTSVRGAYSEPAACVPPPLPCVDDLCGRLPVLGDVGGMGGGVAWARLLSPELAYERGACPAEASALACAQGSEAYVYDYAWWSVPGRGGERWPANSGGVGTFATVDAVAISVLVLWVATSHSIFSLPNTNHRAPLVSGSAGLLSQNWVFVAVVSWNLAGLSAAYVALFLGAVTTGTAVLCSVGIVWNAALHLVWAYLSRRSECLLPEQVDAAVRASAIFPPAGVPRPHSLQHWLQFMRVNEASFSAPMLMACWMAYARDRQETAAVQYAVGFAASGIGLLIPLDALGMAAQDETAYGVMLASGQPMGDLRESWARDRTTRVLDASASAQPRIAIASLGLVAWSTALYASSAPWGEAPPLARWCICIAGGYPCAVVLAGLGRNLARRWWASGGELHDFLAAQRRADEVYTVAWDLMGVAARSALAVGLCLEWPF